MVAKINPRLAGYQPAQLSQLYRRIHDSIAGIPGVSSVALCLYSPPTLLFANIENAFRSLDGPSESECHHFPTTPLQVRLRILQRILQSAEHE
jgi:hypothetical protein